MIYLAKLMLCIYKNNKYYEHYKITGLYWPFCPMPVVKTQLELEKMQSGEILEITADDPGFEKIYLHGAI